MLTKSQIRELPEYIGLTRKHQQYVLFVTLWEKTHGTACRLLRLNKKRVAENEQIQDCIAAIRLGVRPPAPAVAQVIPGSELDQAADALEKTDIQNTPFHEGRLSDEAKAYFGKLADFGVTSEDYLRRYPTLAFCTPPDFTKYRGVRRG